MRVVGLTGGIGAGKSAAATFFAERQVPLVDADQIAHQLTAANGPALPAIVRVFGRDALDANGALDRDRMRAHVFADAAAKASLESILHPMVLARAQQELAATSAASVGRPGYVLLAVPLLFERMTFRNLLWRTLVIDCPISLQRERVKRRSGWDDIQVARVIASQIPRPIRLQLADDVIVNTGDLAALEERVDRCHLCYASSTFV
jgi:dephospho-CoA kinase